MNETQNMASTPDAKPSAGLVRGPQENGQWTLRIAIRDASSGEAREFAFDNRLGKMDPAQATVLPLNDHQFLVLLPGRGADVRDTAYSALMRAPVWAVDAAGAQDIAGLSNAEALLAKAPSLVPFQDVSAALRSFGLLEAEEAAEHAAASTVMGGMPAGIQFDPEFLARGETYLSQEESANNGPLGFFTELDLGLPGLGRLSRDPVAMPGMGGLAVVVLGVLIVSLLVRRRPAPFRR